MTGFIEERRQPPARQRTRASARQAQVRAQIVYRKLDTLKAYANNPRKHGRAQIDKIAASIKEFGFLVPVLVMRDGEIVVGEARVAAARCVGLDEVPTLGVEHLTPAQVRAFRLADNRLAELSEWDGPALAVEIHEILVSDFADISILGWETPEIDMICRLDAGPDEGEDEPEADIPEPPADPVSRPGDLWLLGQHRLLCGSSLEPANWTRLMDGRQARMAFTDPPYNVPVHGHVCGAGRIRHAEFAMASGEMSETEFVDFLKSALGALAEQVMDGGIIQACMDWRHLFEIQTAARTLDLDLLNICVWNKANAGMGSLYRSKHELVLILKKGTAGHINNVMLGKHGRNRSNVWDYPGVNGFGKTRMEDLAAHPTVKPTALVADAICDVSHHGDIVIDGFMGSGTTILAAETVGRRGYGIELEPAYVDVAIQRWQHMTGEQAILEGGESFATLAAARNAQGEAIGV